MNGLIPIYRDLVLVGGGHSHALALRMLAMRPVEGLRLTLVSPASHTPYSGMLPGLIADHYRYIDTHIDLARLCQSLGVRFIEAEVTGLNPVSRRLSMLGRPALAYDLLSLDIGSQPELDSVPGARTYAVPVKPVSTFWARWKNLYNSFTRDSGNSDCRLAIVGGGSGSVELALAMAHRLPGKRLTIELWCGSDELMSGYNKRARRAVSAALASHNIEVHTGSRVKEVQQGSLLLEDGSSAPYDHLFWCTGASAAPWIASSGLPVDEKGFLAVNDTLQSTGDERVFGAGDIATQVNNMRPKAGVFAVRQAPTLARNLRAAAMGKPLKNYKPQKKFLSLVSLGDKIATADKGPLAFTGAWVWRWKNRIDTRFMEQFTQLPPTMTIKPAGRLPELDKRSLQEACGGCGAKVSANALRSALAQLSKDYPQHCVAEGGDAVEVPAQAPIIQSIDILRQITADPWHMGRIAANHALSDLYACGARPVSALAAITLPFGSANIQQRDLQQLLAGALQEFSAADCQLNGGHSLQGTEEAVGFTVNGVPMAPDGRLLNKLGAQVGDRLVLTKPLGTGALFAAHMQGKADGRDIRAAVRCMLQSNREAAEEALAHGASACTDVTGFGLLGHLLDLLRNDLGARLPLKLLPVLGGTVQAVRMGIQSTMFDDNLLGGENSLRRGGQANEALIQLLFDPQTSGGLLICVAPERAEQLCLALQQRGYTHACQIGDIVEAQKGVEGRVLVS